MEIKKIATYGLISYMETKKLFVILINISAFKTNEDNDTYKCVVNDPLNEPSWIFFINGIVECSLNLCLQYTDGDMLLRFEGLDGMR